MPKSRYTFQPYIPRKQKSYVVKFFHPLQHRQVTRGIGTSEPELAFKIADDLRLLCEFPERPHVDLHKHAIAAFFGRESIEYHRASFNAALEAQDQESSGRQQSVMRLLDEIVKLSSDPKNTAAIKKRCDAIFRYFIAEAVERQTTKIDLEGKRHPRAFEREERERKKRKRKQRAAKL
jgi:hypothetical protein